MDNAASVLNAYGVILEPFVPSSGSRVFNAVLPSIGTTNILVAEHILYKLIEETC